MIWSRCRCIWLLFIVLSLDLLLCLCTASWEGSLWKALYNLVAVVLVCKSLYNQLKARQSALPSSTNEQIYQSAYCDFICSWGSAELFACKCSINGLGGACLLIECSDKHHWLQQCPPKSIKQTDDLPGLATGCWMFFIITYLARDSVYHWYASCDRLTTICDRYKWQ